MSRLSWCSACHRIAEPCPCGQPWEGLAVVPLHRNLGDPPEMARAEKKPGGEMVCLLKGRVVITMAKQLADVLSDKGKALMAAEITPEVVEKIVEVLQGGLERLKAN